MNVYGNRTILPTGKMKESLPHGEGPPYLLGKVIQQGVEAFEAAFVNRHLDAPELGVAAFVERDPLGRGGSGQMHAARVSVGGLGEGRTMFRCQPGVPHPGLVREHAAASHKPGTQTHTVHPQM